VPVIEKDPSSLFKRKGWQTALVIVTTLLIAYGMANLEVIRRARAAYLRGEEQFAKKEYKQALWDYQEVQEFYYLPHSSYVDRAQEKEWICRAYLGDWVPPEGPLDADMRALHTDVYDKYKAQIAQITPVGDASYQPAPLTSYEKELLAKGKKQQKKKP